MGAAVGVGAAYGLDTASSVNMMAGAVADSMPGQQGLSNTTSASQENMARIQEEGRRARELEAQKQQWAENDRQYKAAQAAKAQEAQAQVQAQSQAKAAADQQAAYDAYVRDIQARNENIRAGKRAGILPASTQEIPLPPGIPSVRNERVAVSGQPNVLTETGRNQPVEQFSNRGVMTPSAQNPSVGETGRSAMQLGMPTFSPQASGNNSPAPSTTTRRVEQVNPVPAPQKVSIDAGCVLVDHQNRSARVIFQQNGLEFKMAAWHVDSKGLPPQAHLVATNRTGKNWWIDVSGSQWRCRSLDADGNLTGVEFSDGIPSYSQKTYLGIGRDSGQTWRESPCGDGKAVYGICLSYTLSDKQ